MTTAGIDRSVLEIMTSELNAEGYSVFIEPRGAVLPEELRDLQPDAIAVKGIEKIAIQVKAGRSRPRDTSPSPVLPSGAAEAGWELRVYYAGLATSEDIRSMPRDKIAASLNEAQKLADDGLLLGSLACFMGDFRGARPLAETGIVCQASELPAGLLRCWRVKARSCRMKQTMCVR